jgi:hypothetical protein
MLEVILERRSTNGCMGLANYHIFNQYVGVSGICDCLYEWLLKVKLQNAQHQRFRQAYLVIMTIAFLLLFHFASIFAMAEAHNAVGVGWTYLNFQIATVMYALLSDRDHSVLYSMATFY